jgi:hypothetical protein
MEVKEERLKQAIQLAEKMRELNESINRLKRQLKFYEEQFNLISESDLPDLMINIGLSSFRLSDGTTLSIAPVFKISIAKDKMESAYQWLVHHHHDGMVKTRILLPTGVDNDTLKQIILFARNHIKGDVETERTIHHSTLGAWGREMERESMVIPEDIFSVYRSQKTIIES